MPKLFDTKDLLIRHLIILALAIFFSIAFASDAEEAAANIGLGQKILFQFIFIAVIWNGNIALVEYSPYPNWSWETNAKKKIIYTGIVAMFWPALVNYFFNSVMYPIIMRKVCDLGSRQNITFLVVSISITLFINAVFVAIEFFNHWRKSITEKEALKRSTLTAEFESLKSQVNPHFLFNSLNTLSSLIEENPKLATDFVQQLASVYRYLLSQNDKETVSLGEELDFMKSYVFLNQIRFGDNLKVEVSVADNLLNKDIVTLTLQILLENAIKHNVISRDKPLTINIEAFADRLCVRNNLQAKTQLTPTNGIGLSNIKNRYHFLSNQEVLIRQSQTHFEVCVPLI
ncbi:MAG: histidine kinase [Bacteroidia bacterium]|nr:histidine kinase [Bacteroidia bacterium]